MLASMKVLYWYIISQRARGNLPSSWVFTESFGLTAVGSTDCDLFSMTKLQLNGEHLSDLQMWSLMKAVVCGCLSRLQQLWAMSNDIGDAGLTAFTTHCAALPSLQTLVLNSNRIGDAGMTAFSRAVSRGELKGLKELRLKSNCIGDAGMLAFASACADGALLQLTFLGLDDNGIGTRGITALVDACTPPRTSLTLPKLVVLSINRLNLIDEAGYRALTSGLGLGVLPGLRRLYATPSQYPRALLKLKAACAARSITGSSFTYLDSTS